MPLGTDTIIAERPLAALLARETRARGREHLMELLAAERERWALWLPVGFGLGIAIYFMLTVEPARIIAPALLALALIALVLARWHRRTTLPWIALAIVVAGFALAQHRAHSLAAPVIERRWSGELVGTVVEVERQPRGARAVLDRVNLPGLARAATPERIRVRLNGAVAVKPGDRIALRAMLTPPPGPLAPGAYDFQRQAWFMRLGAVGYALGEARLVTRGEEAGWRTRLNRARLDVVDRVTAIAPGPAGAIAATLMTGEMRIIPADIMEAMRDSGLAHLLSISGLHVGMVAGLVFAALRQGLALAPPLALRLPVKKIAAVAAFAAISFYALFAAPNVPTQRAWLMTSVVLAAIVLDRTALTMRLVAWAAMVVLLVSPEAMLGPSFQMSFAAVVALIAAWEVSRRTRPAAVERGWIARAGRGLGGAAMTSLVAGAASGVFALYHFNRFAAYGLAANLIAVPLTGIWIMPWAIIAFLLLPFGLESWALAPMVMGVEAIIAVAQSVAAWPGAVALAPAMPIWGLMFISLGGLWLCLWQGLWRLAGLAGIALGLASIAVERGPDILIAEDGRAMAVRGADGGLHVAAGRTAMARASWLLRDGEEVALAWPASGEGDERLSCDPFGCVVAARGQVVALTRHARALEEDCRVATVVIASFTLLRPCNGPSLVIDRRALSRDGAHALWLDNDGVRIESVRAARGERPWVARAPDVSTPRPAAPRGTHPGVLPASNDSAGSGR